MIRDLYERHFGELRRYCLQLCHSSEMANDLVQETFLRAVERWDNTMSVLAPEQQRAWLYKTARNLFLDLMRRDALLQRKIDFLLDEEKDENGFSRVEMEMLLLRLPPEDRTLFRLRYLENYSAVELGEMFGLPAATIRTKLLRARLFMKKEMIT